MEQVTRWNQHVESCCKYKNRVGDRSRERPEGSLLYSYEQLYIHIYIYIQNHNDDTIKDEQRSSFEKYTSHFIWKGSKGLLKVLLWERWVGGWIEQQHIHPHSYGHNSVSFPFSWAAQPGAWGPSLSGTCSSFNHFSPTATTQSGVLRAPLLGAGFLYRILSPTDWTSCAPSYIIIWRSLFFLWASQFRTQFNPSTIKAISWYSSTGCTLFTQVHFLFWQLGRGQYVTSLFYCYNSEVYRRALLLSLDCSTLPLIRTLYCWVLIKEASSTIFEVFGMTWPEIETMSPGPLAKTLATRPMSRLLGINFISCLLMDYKAKFKYIISFIETLPHLRGSEGYHIAIDTLI